MKKQEGRTVLLGAKVTPSLSRRIDDLASRMGITRSEVVYRIMVDGLDELETAVDIAETRIGSTFVRLVAQFLPDASDRQDVLDQLDRLRDNRRAPEGPSLPFAPD